MLSKNTAGKDLFLLRRNDARRLTDSERSSTRMGLLLLFALCRRRSPVEGEVADRKRGMVSGGTKDEEERERRTNRRVGKVDSASPRMMFSKTAHRSTCRTRKRQQASASQRQTLELVSARAQTRRRGTEESAGRTATFSNSSKLLAIGLCPSHSSGIAAVKNAVLVKNEKIVSMTSSS